MHRILIIGKNSYIGKNLKNFLELSLAADKQERKQYVNPKLCVQKANKKEEPWPEISKAASQIEGKRRDLEKCPLWTVDSVSGQNGEWQDMDFSGYDTVVVCSALVHKNEKKIGWPAYLQANAILPVRIARKAKAAGVSHYIFLSSLAVYGRGQERITVGQRPAPETYYGHSKYLAEQSLLPMADDAFTVTIVRPPMVYGERAKGSYRQLQRLAAVLPLFPRIENQKSVISLQNLCRFLQAVLVSRPGGIFHPQDRVYRSTTELMQMAAGTRKIWLIPFPPALNRWLSAKSKLWSKAFGNLTVERQEFWPEFRKKAVAK